MALFWISSGFRAGLWSSFPSSRFHLFFILIPTVLSVSNSHIPFEPLWAFLFVFWAKLCHLLGFHRFFLGLRWVSLGRWASIGPLLDLFWTSLGPSGFLLGLSWVALGLSWVVLVFCWNSSVSLLGSSQVLLNLQCFPSCIFSHSTMSTRTQKPGLQVLINLSPFVGLQNGSYFWDQNLRFVMIFWKHLHECAETCKIENKMRKRLVGGCLTFVYHMLVLNHHMVSTCVSHDCGARMGHEPHAYYGK